LVYRPFCLAYKKAIQNLNIASIDIISIAKQKSRHDKGLNQETIFIHSEKDPILLDYKSNEIFLLQKIRDKAHETAISFHRKKIRKKITSSILDEIKGIGSKKKQALLLYFKSIEEIKKATLQDLKKIKILTKKDIENISKYFN
jgi:excinuclease ABC subunit C